MKFKIDENLPSHCANIRNYPPGSNPGIIVLRLAEQSIIAAQISIKHLIKSFSQELPVNKLWVVDESKIRIRE